MTSKTPNKWLRNVRTYLDAVLEEKLDELVVPELREEGVVCAGGFADLVNSVLEDEEGKGNEENKEPAIKDKQDITGKQVLHPRSYKTFYTGILKGVRMWALPPHNHCTRCQDFTETKGRINELEVALGGLEKHPEHASYETVVESAGGAEAGWEEVRRLRTTMPDLQKHMDWQQFQRRYLKHRQSVLDKNEALLQLDYGGMTDSAGKKVSVWSATVLAPGREQEHFDFFFDAFDAKKNGQTGIFMLGEMLDRGFGVLRNRYPDVTDFILSGDTGNGYRGV